MNEQAHGDDIVGIHTSEETMKGMAGAGSGEQVDPLWAGMSAQYVRALQVISDVALDHIPLDELLYTLLVRIMGMLEVENVAILLLSEDRRALVLCWVCGPEEIVLGRVRVPMGEGVAGKIAATRQPMIVHDLASVTVANPFLQQHFRSLLGVPLLADGQLVGVLHVASVYERHFTVEECHLLEALAGHIAMAIVHAQSDDGIQRERVEAIRQVLALQGTTERMDEFLSIASHELRTPLTSLTMNIQMLDFWLNERSNRQEKGEKLGAQPSKQQNRQQSEQPYKVGEHDAGPSRVEDAEHAAQTITKIRPLIRRARQGIRRLERLVSDLLDASLIREGRLDMQFQLTDLGVLVREVVKEHQQAHATRTLRLHLTMDRPLLVDADPERIEQVLTHYLANALKYSRPYEPVTVIAGVEDNWVRICVCDCGVGIPAEELEHIWERFYRVTSIEHQTGSQVGLGLGLYICRNIVERHGGLVGVESAVGEGSSFWFSLPLVPTPAELMDRSDVAGPATTVPIPTHASRRRA